MITADEARKAMMKVLQERENKENEAAQNWIHDVVNAAVAQAVERGEGCSPVLMADNVNIAERAERILTADPYNYKVVHVGVRVGVIWYEPSEE